MEKDIFGFADAINLDHLNLEQLKELEKILDKIKQKKWGAPCGVNHIKNVRFVRV